MIHSLYHTLPAIKVDPRVIHEYKRLRNERQLSTLTTSCTLGNSLKISLLNTRSLNRHGVDISKDNRSIQTDVLCLTETHVMPEKDITGTNCLDQCHFYHNKSTDKFERLAFAYRNSVDVVSHHQIPRKSFFSFRQLTFLKVQLNILLLYCKITRNLAGFYEHLIEINFSQNIDLLLGDFNINALDPTSRILQMMSNCVQVVTKSAQISGALLDHVFVRKDLFKKIEVRSVVRILHFSYHDAVVLTLVLKSNARNIENVIAV